MKRLRILLSFALLSFGLWTGCHKTLESGGVYSPAVTTVNPDGTITTTPTALPDLAFYQTDAAFRMSYNALDAVFTWERDNRLFLWRISPKIKHGLDDIRPTAAAMVKNYAVARDAYKKNPTPAGLDLLQTILAKAQQLQATAAALSQNFTTP